MYKPIRNPRVYSGSIKIQSLKIHKPEYDGKEYRDAAFVKGVKFIGAAGGKRFVWEDESLDVFYT